MLCVFEITLDMSTQTVSTCLKIRQTPKINLHEIIDNKGDCDPCDYSAKVPIVKTSTVISLNDDFESNEQLNVHSAGDALQVDCNSCQEIPMSATPPFTITPPVNQRCGVDVLKTRNKSTSDLVCSSSSTGIENIYENGLYCSKLNESINTKLNKSADQLFSSSKVRPRKPSRSNMTPPKSIPTSNVAPTALDQLRLLKDPQHVNDVISHELLSTSGTNHQEKLKELGSVLDSQIGDMECLLTVIAPPRSTSLRHTTDRSRSQIKNPVKIKYLDTQQCKNPEKETPSPTAQNRLFARIKSSLFKPRKQVTTTAPSRFDFQLRSKSLPLKTPRFLKRRPASFREAPCKKSSQLSGHLYDDQHVTLRKTSMFSNDDKTRQILSDEFEHIAMEIRIERKKVSAHLTSIILPNHAFRKSNK